MFIFLTALDGVHEDVAVDVALLLFVRAIKLCIFIKSSSFLWIINRK